MSVAAIKDNRTIWRVNTIEQAVQRMGLVGKAREATVFALRVFKEHSHDGVLLVVL